MSTYEKIATVLLVILGIAVLLLWHNDEGFRQGPEQEHAVVDFDESRGQDFKMGPFTVVIDAHASGAAQAGCEALQPVLVTALHDINKRLAQEALSFGIEGSWDEFEVNAQSLSLLCRSGAEITLIDQQRDTLIVRGLPFSRGVPEGGNANDIGTAVALTATVARAGTPLPSSPQVSVRVLIPDRFLDDVPLPVQPR